MDRSKVQFQDEMNDNQSVLEELPSEMYDSSEQGYENENNRNTTLKKEVSNSNAKIVQAANGFNSLGSPMRNIAQTYSLTSDKVIDEFPNNSTRSIDFSASLKKLKKRTEIELPYTLTQCEDAMFIDQQTVITTEFHYYRNDCIYTNLKPFNETFINGDLIDEEGNQADHLLGTQNYQATENEINPFSQFDRKDLLNLHDEKINIIDLHNDTNNNDFCRYCDHDQQEEKPKPKSNRKQKLYDQSKQKNEEQKHFCLKGIIALYKTSKSGQMQRIDEVDMNMGRKFFHAQDGNMMLTRSRNKELISITNFDQKNKSQQYFKVMAWTAVKLEEVRVKQQLNDGMSKYYHNIKDSFEKLVEVCFVGKCQFVQMTYIEHKKRSLTEQHEFETMIEKNYNSKLKLKKGFEQTKFKLRRQTRKARKHVFFDVITGEVVFEYGGVRPQMEVTNQNGDKVKIFELGMLVKEIREEKWTPKLQFFFVGDFWSTKFKSGQFIFKWMLCTCQVEMQDLFMHDTQQQKMEFLYQKLKECVPEDYVKDSDAESSENLEIEKVGSIGQNSEQYSKKPNYNQLTRNGQKIFIKGKGKQENKNKQLPIHGYYLFDDHWISNQIFTWEINISISSNRLFDQFAIINSPENNEWDFSAKIYYINGPKFQQHDSREQEIPYFLKLPNDCTIRHGRNPFIKPDLYYDLSRNGETKTICLRPGHPEFYKRVKPMNIKVQDQMSIHDSWLILSKKIVDEDQTIDFDISQCISVSKGDQSGFLQTRIPISFIGQNPIDYITVTRNTKRFYTQSANFPFIAFNLGESKILIQNIQEVGKRRAYILNLTDGEKFVSFVQINKFEDIGFFSEDLRIECCSHIVYLTKKLNDGGKTKYSGNTMNLLILDPFNPEIQAVLFKSSTNYDNEIFKSGDFILNSMIQCNKGLKNKQQRTFLWSQFQTKILKQKMFQNNTNFENNSDNAMDEDDMINKTQEDEFYYLTNCKLSQNPLILDHHGFIYYVTQENGVCHIMEGNPKDPELENHSSIFQLTANKILSFYNNLHLFYLMDDHYIIYKLQRNKSDRQLSVIIEMTMNEIVRSDYNPVDFESFILDQHFSILKSKIFYFYEKDNNPFPEGILNTEELTGETGDEDKKQYLRGPFKIQGSNIFYNVFRCSKYNAFIQLFQLPDQVAKTLLNDFQNQVTMSTFLENGRILLKCKNRFHIFSCDGNFIDEVEFNDSKNEEDEENSISKYSDDLYTPSTLPEFTKINKNPKNRELIDFTGHPYEFKTTFDPPVSVFNRMELIQFSGNNTFFLFYDRISIKMIVYELCMIKIPIIGDAESLKAVKNVHDRMGLSEAYEFILQFELNCLESQLFKYLALEGINGFQYFRQNPDKIQIQNNGIVKFCYCENIGINEAYASQKFEDKNQVQQCKLFCCIFKQQGYSRVSKNYSLTEPFLFPFMAQYNSTKIMESQVTKLQKRINNVRIIQSRWPEIKHDYSKYENLYSNLIRLDQNDPKQTFAQFFYDDLIVVYCCNILKFGRIIYDNLQKKYGMERINGEVLQDVKLTFSSDTEIIKIVETSTYNCLQIQAKNHHQNIVFIVTWDFEKNIEKSMFQVLPSSDATVDTHLVKGMNEKMNYYIDQDYVIDLDTNIPLRQRNVDQNIDTCGDYKRQIKSINLLFNQRKLYQDNCKFLGIEKAHQIFFDLTRIDILRWKDVYTMGESSELIDKASTIDSLNLCFNGVSLFHYFAHDANTIDVIRKKYTTESHGKQLTRTQQTLGLQIVNIDNEGKTALLRAIQNQSTRSFEIMIQMIKDNSNLCITKSLLSSLSLILTNEQVQVLNFFEGTFYQPPQMRIDWFIPWQDDIEELVFACHTSVISQELLLSKIQQFGIQHKQQKPQCNNNKHDQIDDMTKADIEQDVFAKQLKIIQKRKRWADLKLNRQYETGLAEGELPLKRVTVEVLDFDWIFDNDNASIFLEILANDVSNKLLTMRSIKIFIKLMWQYYQPAIIRRVFIPYIFYLLDINYLAGHLVREYMNSLTKDTLMDEWQIRWVALQTWMCTIFGVVVLVTFGMMEISSLVENGFGYLKDPWNCIDITTVYLNLSLLMMMFVCLIKEEEYFNVQLIHSIGSFSCFFMWLKVFYWMRLYSSLAYYVNLIIQTIVDINYFMMMVFIILISFASFMYVANRNLEGTTGHYIGVYLQNEMIDSVISIYLIGALGDFTTSQFKEGSNYQSVMFMFLFCTFMVSVVFMNMLISIMGNTFSKCMETLEENGLREQIILIDDHQWLLDLKQIFNEQKYIMRIALVDPKHQNQYSEERINQEIALEKLSTTREQLKRKVEKMNQDLGSKIDDYQADTFHELSSQFLTIEKIIAHLKANSLQNQEKEKEEKNEGNREPKFKIKQGGLIEQKKSELVKVINFKNQDLSNMTNGQLYEISLDFVNTLDKGKSGELEYEEFYEFFANTEDIYLTDEQIKQLFFEFDVSGDGQISLEELARGITMIVTSNNADNNNPVLKKKKTLRKTSQ